MTADEAERAYMKLSEPDGPHPTADWRHVAAKIPERLATITDAISDALGRASHGLERSHWG
jgi:hypothetical protein